MMHLRKAFFLAATGLALLGFSRPASADVVVYASTALGDFGTLNLSTGEYSSVGATGADTSIVGMGLIGSTLYGVDASAPGAGYYTIDTLTGAATKVATLPTTAAGGTTGFGTTFFSLSQDDPTVLSATDGAGASSVINNLPTFPAAGLVAINADSTLMYVSAFTGNPGAGDDLYTIAAVGGSVSLVGSLGTSSITGIIFGNTLYSLDGDNIYTYDISSGLSGPLSTIAITGLDPRGDQVFSVAAVVPEPSTMVIAGVSVFLAGLVRGRRRRSV